MRRKLLLETLEQRVVLTGQVPAVTIDGLVSWYQAEGNANDTADGNQGTLVSVTTAPGGRVGSAFKFAASNNQVVIQSNDSLTLQSFTLDAWVFPTFVNGGDFLGGEIIGKQLSANSNGVSLSILGPNINGEFTFAGTKVSGSPSFPSTAGFALNTWHHVAMTSNGSVVRGYVDGVLQAGSMNLAGDPIVYDTAPVATPWTIGGHTGLPFGFANHYFDTDALIDEVGIYQRGLSGSQVAAIYNQGSLGRYTIPGGQQFSLPGAFTDADSGSWTATVNYGDGSGTQPLTLNPGHTFTIAHAYATAGTRTITVAITDDTSNTTTHSLVVNVTTPTNTAPVANTDAYDATEDLQLDVTAVLGVLANDTDAQNNPLTAVLVAGPSHGALTLNTNGSFSYIPTGNYHGPDAFTYRASDGTLLSNTGTVNITVASVNDAPVLGAIGNKNVEEGLPLTFTATATDIDTEDTLTFSLQGEPGGAAIDSDTGVFTWTPTTVQGPAVYTFDVRVSDGHTTDSETITVTVTEPPPVNSLPSVSVLNLQSSTIDEDGTAEVSGTVSDADAADTHTVSIDWGDGSAPEEFPVDNLDHTFSATHQYLDDDPTTTPSDLYSIQVTPQDNHAGTGATATISLTVLDVDPTVTPIAGPTVGVQGLPLSFSSTFDDVGTQDILTATWQVLDSASAVVATGSGTSLGFTPAAGGSFTVQFDVCDDDGGDATTSTVVNVVGVQMMSDPERPGQSMLVIGGAAGSDTLAIAPTAVAGEYSFTLNGLGLGSYSPTGSVQFNGNGGSDSIILNGNGSSNAFEIHSDCLVLNALPFFDHGTASRTINALGSGDTVTVYDGSATVDGGSASDTLAAAGAGSHNWLITSQNAGSLDGQVFFSQIERLTGGGGADNFHFADGIGVNGPIDGGGGSDTLDYSAFMTPVSVNLQSGNATKTGGILGIEQLIGGQVADSLTGPNIATTWTLAGLGIGSGGSASYSSFENLTGGNQGDTFVLSSAATALSGNLSGGGGADTLQYSGSASTTVNLETHTSTRIGGTFTSISNIIFGSGTDTVIGPAANTTWNITGSQAASGGGVTFQNVETLTGAAAADTVRGPDAGNTWSLTGADSGSLLGVSWTGMERLTGGSQAETFEVQAGGSLSGILNGGGGSDTLSYSSYGSPVSVNLATSTATGIASFSSLAAFSGSSAASDVLIAGNTNNTWTVTSPTAGTVKNSSFSGFENLQGGTGADTFKPAAGVTFAGSFDGSAGVDKLDYGGFTSSVEVNLVAGTATGIGGVSGVEEITGGDGNDFLVGNSGDNVISGGDGDDIIFGWSGIDSLNGNGGRDFLIGGSGGDTIHGNATEDILVSGTLSFASEAPLSTFDRTAVDAIMSEWRRTDLSYSARLAHLNGTTAGGLNGAYVLNATTALDDNVTDFLHGDAGQDWLLAGDKDSVIGGGNDTVTFI